MPERYQRVAIPFLASGVQTATPDDSKSPGKFAKLLNVRAYRKGEIAPRGGLVAPFGNNPGGGAVHSGRQFLDSNGVEVWVLGVGTTVKRGTGAVAWSTIDTSFSGFPVSVLFDRPETQGLAYAYIYDQSKQEKVDSSFNLRNIGIAPPGKSASAAYTLTPAGAPTVAVGSAGGPTGVYQVKYRYRHEASGVTSNYSAESDEVTVDNEAIDVSDLADRTDTSYDKIDIFLLGGTIQQWTYVDTVDKAVATYSITATDSDLAGNETQETFERDKPWVLTDSSGVATGGNPLGRTWGPVYGVIFAILSGAQAHWICWTNGNEPDTQDRANTLQVSGANEPLINGCIYDNRAFAYSNETFYVIYPTVAGLASFEALPTGCSRGPVHPWAVTVGPEMYFIARDGIFATSGGPERSLTEDLYDMFPHEGITAGPTAKNGVVPPNLNVVVVADLPRLTYHDGYLFFDYKGTDNNYYTWVYDLSTGGWFTDAYAIVSDHVTLHIAPEGQIQTIGFPPVAAKRILIGTEQGGAFNYVRGFRDNGLTFSCAVWPPKDDGGDPTTQKLYGDFIMELDRDGRTVTIQPAFDNDSNVPGADSEAIASGSGRQRYIVDLNSGSGRLARNASPRVSWDVDSSDGNKVGPILYKWHPRRMLKPDEVQQRAVEWHEFREGLKDAYVWGCELWVDTEGEDIDFSVFADQADTGVNFTANADGEQKLRFTWVGSVFRGSLGKLVIDTFDGPWRLTRLLWLADEEPPLTPDFDSNWRKPLDGCGVAYVTGVKVRLDTLNISKALIFKSEHEGTVSTLTARESQTAQHNGPRTKTFTFEPFRASQVRAYSTDGVEARVYDICWIAHPEPPALAHGDALYQDFGKIVMVKGVEVFADSANLAKDANIELDGSVYTTINIQHNGRQRKAYAIPVAGGDSEFPRAGSARFMPQDTDDLYLYNVRWIVEEEPEFLTHFAPVWSNGGRIGAKLVQGVKVTADTRGASKTFLVEHDGGAALGPFTIQTTRKQTVPFWFTTPIIASQMRVRPTDSNAGFRYEEDWIFNPAPEAAAVWRPPVTSHGFPGYHHVRDLQVAVFGATAAIGLTLNGDGAAVGSPLSFTPSSSGYHKVYLVPAPNKAKQFEYVFSSANPFRLFLQDSVVRAKGWGDGGPYRELRPFGDDSFTSGARI